MSSRRAWDEDQPMVTIPLTDADETQVETFAGALFNGALAVLELASIELGRRLGLYDILLNGPVSAASLAAEAGIHERYAREWLEQQAVGGVLTVEGDRFTLPTGHAHVLLDEDSEAYLMVGPMMVPWAAKAIAIMEPEFRAGAGVAFGEFDLHDVQAAFTRPVFTHHLTQNWLPALPDIHSRLEAGEALRVADMGCGEGRAGIRIAEAYPAVSVDGFDPDEASIAAARKAAADAGVADRVTFHQVGGEGLETSTSYDLVLLIEMLHDVPDPVGVLEGCRRLAGDSGAVLVADERTDDAFSPDADEMQRFFYGFSVLHCLAVSMQGGGAGTGTVIRADTVREYALRAGFADVQVLDVEHPQFRLYRLS